MSYFSPKQTFFLLSISVLIATCCGLLASTAKAQSVASAPLGSPFSLESSPSTPGPDEVVTLTIKSFSLDLNRSDVAWYVNDELVADHAGQTELSIKTETTGDTVITVVVTTADGNIYQNNLSVRPTSVDLLWEAGSYVPPFYQGKALLGINSPITIVAIPHMRLTNGSLIAPEDIVFTWKQGTRVLGSKSGRGKNTLTLTSYPFFKALDIRVEAESVEGGLNAKNQISVSPVSPFILFYESHPTRGVQLENARRGSFTLQNDEVSLVAEPYFFVSTERRDVNLIYSWRVYNESVSNPSVDQSLITLRPTGGGGSASLHVSLRHNVNILQQADANIAINFSKIESH